MKVDFTISSFLTEKKSLPQSFLFSYHHQKRCEFLLSLVCLLFWLRFLRAQNFILHIRPHSLIFWKSVRFSPVRFWKHSCFDKFRLHQLGVGRGRVCVEILHRPGGGRSPGHHAAFVDEMREWGPGGVSDLFEVSLPRRVVAWMSSACPASC